MPDEYIEKVCSKLRDCVAEFGQEVMRPAVIVGDRHGIEEISGHRYICAPTIGHTTLGNVDFAVARFFETS